MSAGQGVILIGVALAFLAVMVMVMIRLERVQRRQIERRREAWKAAGGVDAQPDDFIGHGGWGGGNFG
jgi:hypothetical protein